MQGRRRLALDVCLEVQVDPRHHFRESYASKLAGMPVSNCTCTRNHQNGTTGLKFETPPEALHSEAPVTLTVTAVTAVIEPSDYGHDRITSLTYNRGN